MYEIKDELILICWYYQRGYYSYFHEEFYFHEERKARLKKLKKPWFTLTYSSGVWSGPASHALHEQRTFA